MASKQKISDKKSPYHHGNLKQELIQAALELTERYGPMGFNLREAARKAGVSTAAPYRHFKNKNALMVAIAEIAVEYLQEFTDKEIAKSSGEGLGVFRAQGLAFVRLAIEYPVHFRILSIPEYSQNSNSEKLKRYFDTNVKLTRSVLEQSSGDKKSKSEKTELIRLSAFALIYGFSQMIIDGHFGQKKLTKSESEVLAKKIMNVFYKGMENYTGKE